MASIAGQTGFETQILLTTNATREAVTNQIYAAAKVLTNGDIFLITFSGHGGLMPNTNEVSGYDQTWCLFDGQLTDNELYKAWNQFAAGVRILLFSDSCHSGTIYKMLFNGPRSSVDEARLGALTANFVRMTRSPSPMMAFDVSKFLHAGSNILSTARPSSLPDTTPTVVSNLVFRPQPAAILYTHRVKSLSPIGLVETYEKHKDFYDAITSSSSVSTGQLAVSVLSFSACRDNELAFDGPTNSVFTAAVKKVWGTGFNQDYSRFYVEICCAALAENYGQAAQMRIIDKPDDRYEAQRPFTIEAPN